ncbi:MAG: caspase family protein [Rhodoplanes sp.]|uniref:caspase family protein n=1 Tax=Rhodoplanes sp. TaxID=1968906 RepID=UPI00183CC21C|nr:caspase family protein [Rhodoplanes sp.]NVO15926.1 caspase family protein [Rhodoplanes sp.]
MAVVLVLTGLAAAAPAVADTRVALVVGNGAYRSISPLDNPVNDARLMAQTLRSLGFTLVGGAAQLDLDKSALDAAVQAFGTALQGADVGLFYYAGHGVQVRGANYLVPVGANPVREADIDFQMLDTALVLRQMEAAGTRLNLVILDACRNNPFGGRGLRATAGGLAQMQAPEGTLISFATQPGNVALDGQSGNSPYTAALAQTIRRAGLDIFQTFNEVGLAVKRSTAGAQQPWVSSSPIAGTFYFSGTQAEPLPSAPQAPPVGAAGSDAERAWAVTKDTTSIAVLEDFVRQFGPTPYGSMARARLEELRRERPPVAPEPRQPQPPPPPVVATLPPVPPSFDCATDRGIVEQAICRSDRLSRLDRNLDALYTVVRGRLRPDQQIVLRDEQRAWLKQRAACGDGEPCLIAVYESRIAQLQAWR